MHKVLERQLRKHFGTVDAVPAPLQPFLAAVDRFYEEADQDRALVERSLDLASQELLDRNDLLHQQQAELRVILDSVPAAIFYKDGENRILGLNEAGARLFGKPRAELEGASTYDLLPRPVARKLHDDDLEVIHNGQPHLGVEEAHPDGNGGLHWFQTDKVPHRGPDGRIDGVIVLSLDITDRKTALEEVRRRTATIQLLQQVPLLANEATTVEEAARLCLDKVCDYTGWPIGHAYFVNESGTELVSRQVWHRPPGPTFEAFRRVTEATVLGPGIGLPGRVWEGRHAIWLPDVMTDVNFSRAKRAADLGVHAAFAFPIMVDGQVLAVLEFFSEQIQAPDKDLLEVMGNVGEQLGRVLERRRSEAELKAAYAQLQEVDRARIQFINTAAHELGTPLTPIKIQVEMVKNRLTAGAEPQQRKSVEILERNVDRLSHLVKDLLDSARLQTGQLKVTAQPADLALEATRAVEAYGQIADKAGIDLHFDGGVALPVAADVRRLGQVLDNLLSNAVKFTPVGGTIQVTAHREGDWAKVIVRDSGIGIRPELVAKLFLPFSQVHDTMQITQPGTGLGLYISKGIVEALGGMIGCESAGVGQGTAFWFALRMKPDAAPAAV